MTHEMALCCSSQCLHRSLRSLLGATLSRAPHRRLGSSRAYADLQGLSSASSPSVHAVQYLSFGYRRSFHNASQCGQVGFRSTLYRNAAGFTATNTWRQARVLSFMKFPAARALSVGSLESADASIESDVPESVSQYNVSLREMIEAKERELEANARELESLRSALRDSESRTEGGHRADDTRDFQIADNGPTGAAPPLSVEEVVDKREEAISLNADIEEESQGYEVALSAAVDQSPPSHPWPEWQSFLDRLEAEKYFDFKDDGIKKNEDAGLGENAGRIKRASMGFARHRDDILSSLPRKQLQTIALFGCPSTDRKAVNAGKRLRAFLGIAEGSVCEPCEIRTSCSRAYNKPGANDTLATTDVIRLLTQYALSTGAEKRTFPKDVQEAVRKLLSEVVTLSEIPRDPSLPRIEDVRPSLSRPDRKLTFMDDDIRSQRKAFDNQKRSSGYDIEMKPGDWKCPECNFINFSRNKECRECNTMRAPKELRPGDWQCKECQFVNFSKNTVCRECNAPNPTREMRQGDWQCPECKFVNFAKNKECYECTADRPRAATGLLERGPRRSSTRGGGNGSTFGRSDDRGRNRFGAAELSNGFGPEGRRSKHEEWKPDLKKKGSSKRWDEVDDFDSDDFDSDDFESDDENDLDDEDDGHMSFSGEDEDKHTKAWSKGGGGRGGRVNSFSDEDDDDTDVRRPPTSFRGGLGRGRGGRGRGGRGRGGGRFGERDSSRGQFGERDSSRGRFGERDSSRGRFEERDSSRGRFEDRDSSRDTFRDSWTPGGGRSMEGRGGGRGDRSRGSRGGRSTRGRGGGGRRGGRGR